jgi:hypothetical protein
MDRQRSHRFRLRRRCAPGMSGTATVIQLLSEATT